MIRPKISHMFHPARTMNTAASLIKTHVRIVKFGERCARMYENDSRYDLAAVTRGFADRLFDTEDDGGILDRICASYEKAIGDEGTAPHQFHASPWWEKVRVSALDPVRRALSSRDTASLRRMYRNLFRDPSSTGLAGVPFGNTRAYFSGKISDLHRRYYLGDALCGIDHWQARTAAKYPLTALSCPATGNPFGVVLDGTLIRSGAPFHHYSSHATGRHLAQNGGTVVEIGGGFGGMAWYLLRDRSGVTYVDFDLPESLALAAYYLLKAIPEKRFLLYGEAELNSNALERYDIVLMPPFAVECMPSASASVVFSSHTLSDLRSEALETYVQQIARISAGKFLYMGSMRGANSILTLTGFGERYLRLAERRASGWNAHRYPVSDEVECLFEPVMSTRMTKLALRES